MLMRRQPYYQVVGRYGMGQAVSAEPWRGEAVNRLLGIPSRLITHRRNVMIKNPVSRPLVGLSQSGTAIRTFDEAKTQGEGYFLNTYGPEPIRSLVAVTNNPSPQELEDAKAVDIFFHPLDTGGYSSIPSFFKATLLEPREMMLLVHTTAEKLYGDATANPFLLLDPEVASAFSLRAGFYAFNAYKFFTYFKTPEGWGINVDKPWGEYRDYVYNIIRLQDVMEAYPWPNPVEYTPGYWFWEVQNVTKEIQPFLQAGGKRLSDEDIRTFITLSLVQNYDNIMIRIAKRMERDAKNDARRELIKKIALGVTTLIIGGAVAIAGGALVGAVFSSLFKGMDAVQKIEAAKSLATVAEQFALSDAAFSAEIMRVANMINAQAAEAKEAEPPTPEEIHALVEDIGMYEIQIEGKLAATTQGSAEGAANYAMQKSTPGDRVEIFFIKEPGAEKVSVGFFIRTGQGMVKVPPEAEDEVRAAPRARILEIVSNAEGKVQAQVGEEKGFPWWVLIPAAAMIL